MTEPFVCFADYFFFSCPAPPLSISLTILSFFGCRLSRNFERKNMMFVRVHSCLSSPVFTPAFPFSSSRQGAAWWRSLLARVISSFRRDARGWVGGKQAVQVAKCLLVDLRECKSVNLIKLCGCSSRRQDFKSFRGEMCLKKKKRPACRWLAFPMYLCSLYVL